MLDEHGITSTIQIELRFVGTIEESSIRSTFKCLVVHMRISPSEHALKYFKARIQSVTAKLGVAIILVAKIPEGFAGWKNTLHQTIASNAMSKGRESSLLSLRQSSLRFQIARTPHSILCDITMTNQKVRIP